MLQLKNIYKSYMTGGSRQIALDGINLKFRKSEFVTLLGPSGSGKTTCLNIIGGLEHPDKGDLIINGKSTKDFSDSNWDSYRNSFVSFIFKKNTLIPHLSILENVKIAISLTDLSKEEKQQKALDALNRVGIKDYMRKTSEFLSKEEIQRVAIARALVNDPKIILADEPTGNLDSKSSIEIMNLMKEVFKDKLVIIVTQNHQIAKFYATRVITFRDGEVMYDSNPLKEDLYQEDINLKRINMRISTAVKLAIRDISNKKMRTFLCILMSSIGIIGLAFIISLITGFNEKISSYENDTLADFPIIINKTYNELNISENLQKSINTKDNEDNFELYTDEEIIYSYNSDGNNKEHKNQITQEYIKYIQDMDKSLFSAISYDSQVNMNILKKDESGKVAMLDTSAINFSSYPEDNGGEKYLEKNYDLLYGYYPTDKNDIVLIVDEYNRLDTNVLNALGIDCEQNEKVEFDKLIGKEYKIVFNNEFYKKNGDYFYIDSSEKNLNKLYNSKKSMSVNITGILRAKKNNSLSNLPNGISYSNELCNYYIKNCQKSEIVKAQKSLNYNVITGQSFENNKVKGTTVSEISGVNVLSNINQSSTKDQMISSLGASFIPSKIIIYPKNFEAKSDIVEYLNKYNEGKNQDQAVLYKDTSTIINKLSTNIMKSIIMVLITFVSLLLLISIITIFVLTCISVLERKREACILRVLGARKRDIICLFAAENLIIGLLSGILGIAMAYIFIIPVNYTLNKITGLPNTAILKPKNALLIIIISILITLIGGYIPAKIASRKNPVEILKNE